VVREIGNRFAGDNHDRTNFATCFVAPPLYSTNITDALFEFPLKLQFDNHLARSRSMPEKQKRLHAAGFSKLEWLKYFSRE
jgi:hypothetical protein